MSNELTRWDDHPPRPRPRRAISRLEESVQVERARLGARVAVEETRLRATSVVAEAAVSEVMYLKAVQREAETRNPDAADAVALIVNTAVHQVARDVARFGREL